MRPIQTTISRTSVREPSAVKRQGMNARKQADQRRERVRGQVRRTGGGFARFSRAWGASLALLALLVGGAFLLHHQAVSRGWIALRTVQCRGLSLVSAQEICRRGGLWNGTPLTALSTAEVEARLRQDPRLTEVEVRRVWPHGVRVTVVEEVPQARDQRGRGYGVSGRSLGRVSPGLALPLLEGNPVPGEELGRLMAGLETLRREDSSLWKAVRSLRVAPGGMTAQVEGIPAGVLLPLEGTTEALRRASWLYAQLGDAAGRVETMDLRHAPYAVLVPMGRTGT